MIGTGPLISNNLQSIKIITGDVKIMKKRLASVVAGLLVFLGCAGMQQQDYKDITVHEQLVENRQMPMMNYPPEAQPLIDQLAKQGFVLNGAIVDNDGNYCLHFNNDKGEGGAIITIPSVGATRLIDTEKFWEMYEKICVENNYCTENPYDLQV
jgi:hypothetical protein